MKKGLLNKRVRKLTVRELKNALKDADDDSEVVLGFYMSVGNGVHFGYLADVFKDMKYDSVLKEKLNDSKVVELACYQHEYSTYVERKDDK